MSNHVILVSSCQFSGLFQKFSKVGEGRVKYVFLGLRRQLRCQAEGKITTLWFFTIKPLFIVLPSGISNSDYFSIRLSGKFKNIVWQISFLPKVLPCASSLTVRVGDDSSLDHSCDDNRKERKRKREKEKEERERQKEREKLLLGRGAPSADLDLRARRRR
jgi:hypothetical protein